MIQKRWRELMFGARPMIEPGRLSPLGIAIKEIADGKIQAEAIHAGDDDDA
jgi:DNA-directed RNA polymerase subunit K/omega